MRPQLDPICGACGGDLAVDARYHPEHAMAVDFGDPPVSYATASGALASEVPQRETPAKPHVTLVHVLKPKNGAR